MEDGQARRVSSHFPPSAKAKLSPPYFLVFDGLCHGAGKPDEGPHSTGRNNSAAFCNRCDSPGQVRLRRRRGRRTSVDLSSPIKRRARFA
jgi:hypothetical protein